MIKDYINFVIGDEKYQTSDNDILNQSVMEVFKQGSDVLKYVSKNSLICVL